MVTCQDPSAPLAMQRRNSDVEAEKPVIEKDGSALGLVQHWGAVGVINVRWDTKS